MSEAPDRGDSPTPDHQAVRFPAPGAGHGVVRAADPGVREEERRRRRARLEQLLPAIAEALDIRAVFPRLTELIQPVVPHTTVAFGLLTPDRGGLRIQMASNYEVRDLPEYRFTADDETVGASWRSFVAHDARVIGEGVTRVRTSPAGAPEAFVELRPGVAWTRVLGEFGVRSILRVPIRIKGEPVGAISFGMARPDAYGDDDVELAERIADHVALAIAHERLAEEALRAAQAQEREERLQARVAALVRQLETTSPGHRALGVSPAWTRALGLAARVAPADTTVLVTGESGTGKEVIARAIHRGSPRSGGPFVALNCAALPEHLLESELFGHERGAFTGAHATRVGRIEQAAGGVLFLDEVGEMSPGVQAKFLRVLQEREFQRVGGARTIRADVRVVAATNREPRAAIARGELREDLYYRLSAFEIALPPLRERPEDVLVLANAFVEELAATFGRPPAGLSEDARDRLLAYRWPGNVRELRNAIERAMILCEGGLITGEHLPIGMAALNGAVADGAAAGGTIAFPPGGIRLDAIERDLLERAMAAAGRNKTRAAKLLGIPRGKLYSLLRRHRDAAASD